MTTVAVLCDPPRPGVVLHDLVESSPLSADDAAELYAALLKDTVQAVERSGGELLVNYRADDAVTGGETDAEAAVRAVVADAIDPTDTRFEVQVGESFAGRVGNTATHLLEGEAADTVGIVRPEAAFLARPDIDQAAMKLRSHEVVLGPAPGGRVYYAGFAAPIDYTDSYMGCPIETLTQRALQADHSIDYLSWKPYLETAPDLADIITNIRARHQAGVPVPQFVSQWITTSELQVTAHQDGLSVTR